MIETNIKITNGSISQETIDGMIRDGWNFIVTVPAMLVHPYALPSDNANIFTKYVQYKKENEETIGSN